MRRVFVLEDDPFRIEQFRKACEGRHDLTLTDHLSGPRGAFTLYQPPYDLVYLDHDLGGRQMVDSDEEETGAAFVRWLPPADEHQPVITIHSYNLPGATTMHRLLRDKGYTRVVLWPFCQTVIDTLTDAVISEEK